METKHTPGPWTMEDKNFIVADEKVMITEVYDRANYVPRNGYVIPDEETAEANARLISAAPKMLEALQKITQSHPDGNPMHLIQIARAAISKATL